MLIRLDWFVLSPRGLIDTERGVDLTSVPPSAQDNLAHQTLMMLQLASKLVCEVNGSRVRGPCRVCGPGVWATSC